MADEENIQLAPPANQAGAKNPLLTILVLLNTLAIGGVAYFQMQVHKKLTSQPDVRDIISQEMKKRTEEKETGQAKEQDGILFPLNGFTANLAQGDGPRRYVRMSPVLKFSKDSNEQEFKAKKPQIRDAIISILNSKRPPDLLKIEGKKYLKEEIKSAINVFLIDGRVIDVFYVSFQVN